MDGAQLKKGLLSVINRYLHDTPLCACEDWQSVYQFAKKHSLTAIFYLGVQGDLSVPEQVRQQAKDDFEVEVMQQALQDYAAQSLFQRFKEEKIAFLPLKGYQIRKLYPNPEARFSCDLDVFYDEKDEEKVGRILREEGYLFVIENAAHQEWQRDTVTVEMHYMLMGQAPVFEDYYQDVWEKLRLVDGTEYTFRKEDEYVYFLAHAAKHLLGGGIGIRTVLDGYMYGSKTSFDHAYLDEQLSKTGLKKFATILQTLATAWFGGGEETAEIKLFGDFVLSSGVYGNRSNYVATTGETTGKAKGKYLLLSIFPRYRDMKSWYPVVKKCPILLPFVWVYRWIEVLFTRRKSFVKVAKDVKGMEKEHIVAMQKIKEMTGLVL